VGSIAAAAGPQALPAALQQGMTGLREVGFTGVPESAAPTPAIVHISAPSVAPAARPSFTAAELSTISGFLASAGHDQSFPDLVATALGLPAPLVLRQVSGTDDNTTTPVHFFNQSKTDPSVVVLSLLDDKNVLHAYRIDAEFRYVAGYVSAVDGQLTPIPASQGTPGMEAEIRWWAKTADANAGS
jgi:hypothetical protein